MCKFENPAVTADVIVERKNRVLLVQRKNPPYKGRYALPGGFLNYGRETVEQTAQRELFEETGLVVEIEDLELLGIKSDPKRDPRGHIISPYFIVKKFKGKLNAGDDAKEVKWFPLNNLPNLAFDHEEIIKHYIEWRKENDRQ